MMMVLLQMDILLHNLWTQKALEMVMVLKIRNHSLCGHTFVFVYHYLWIHNSYKHIETCIILRELLYIVTMET